MSTHADTLITYAEHLQLTEALVAERDQARLDAMQNIAAGPIGRIAKRYGWLPADEAESLVAERDRLAKELSAVDLPLLGSRPSDDRLPSGATARLASELERSVFREGSDGSLPVAAALDAVVAEHQGLIHAAMEYRAERDRERARADRAEKLLGTGLCPYCETCLGCGCQAGPVENHDADCPVEHPLSTGSGGLEMT